VVRNHVYIAQCGEECLAIRDIAMHKFRLSWKPLRLAMRMNLRVKAIKHTNGVPLREKSIY
jgi:hypothetical protein